ncbi:Ig-like domain-containing protein [Labedella populi]|nr:Ig-like domain-containing protein [Labedella populi]
MSARELRPRRLIGSILIMFALIGAPGVASPATATGEGAACVTDAPGMNNCARFTFTGGAQSFTVPPGVTSLRVTLDGAGGAGSAGGRTIGTVMVAAGGVFSVTVGGKGLATGDGGYGGGGDGGGCSGGGSGGGSGNGLCGDGGGGLTGLWANDSAFVRAAAVLIAGGGGGRGAGDAFGGDGGGPVGGDGSPGDGPGGTGGTATAPGAGGSGFTGASGGSAVSGGGGGGGGWYGGGGGVGSPSPNGASGGGGGSGYVGGPGVIDAVSYPGAAGAPGADGTAIIEWAAPATTLTAPRDGSVSNQVSPSIVGTGSPGNTVTVTDGRSGGIVCTATVRVEHSWSCVPVVPLSSGSHLLTATETHPHGFFYPPSAPSTYIVDLTPPAVPTITGPARTTSTTPTLTGRSDPGTRLAVEDASGTTVCTTTANASGSWSCTTVALAAGRNVLTPIATNALGNSASGPGFAVDVVFEAPVPTPVPPPTEHPPPTVQPSPTVPARDAPTGPSEAAPAGTHEAISMALGFGSTSIARGVVTTMRGTVGPNTTGGTVALTFTGRVTAGAVYRSVDVTLGDVDAGACVVRATEFSCSFTLHTGESADVRIRVYPDALNAPDRVIQQFEVSSTDPDQDNAMTVATPVSLDRDTSDWVSAFSLDLSSFPDAFVPLLALLLLALAATVSETERRRAAATRTSSTKPGVPT